MRLRIALAVFVAIVIVIAAFAFFTPHANRGGEQAANNAAFAATPGVTLTDSFKRGMHTISGSIHAPTPCTSLTADATVASGTPDSILIAVVMPPDTGICLQQITLMTFKVQALAGADAHISVKVNGQEASTTLTSL